MAKLKLPIRWETTLNSVFCLYCDEILDEVINETTYRGG